MVMLVALVSNGDARPTCKYVICAGFFSQSEGSLTNVCDTELLQSKNDQLAAETHLLR